MFGHLSLVIKEIVNNQIRLSRKEYILLQQKKFLQSLNVGDVISGNVEQFTDYAAFIKIYDHLNAFLHVSEISWHSLDHPSDELSIGQKIEVKILQIDLNKNQLKVSRKQLLEKPLTPWEKADFDEKYKVGKLIQVEKLIKITKGDILVQIEQGLNATIPKRTIPNSIINLEQYFADNNVYCQIENIDADHQKMRIKFIDQSEFDDDINSGELQFNENHNTIYINYWKNEEKLRNEIDSIKQGFPEFFPIIDFDDSVSSRDFVEYYIFQVFKEGLPSSFYFSNTTLKEGLLDVTIRPNLSQNPLLEEKLPKNHTMCFKGHLSPVNHANPVFIIDRILLSSDYERKPFELERQITPMISEDRVYPENSSRENNLFDQEFINAFKPISLIAAKKLEEWESFLEWSQQYAEQNLSGYRFFHKNFINDKLVFHAIVDGEDELRKLVFSCRRGDFDIYDLEYSTNQYSFNYNAEKKRRQRSLKLGVFENYSILKINQTSSINFKDKKLYIDFSDTEFRLDDQINNIVDEARFKEPVIVELHFNLNDDHQYELELLEDETDIEIFKEKIFDHYYDDGFIANSAIGSFAQIRRQKKALNRVISGESFAPFLSSWLFDIKNAQKVSSDEKVSDWLNKDINEDQKLAVVKMMNVPNIGLIQGPPGTGKTTVIAEIIYQSVLRGKKVLLTSQTNLAVDNALDRLASNPKIRAIRFGKGNKLSDEGKKFAENNIVTNFYNNIAENCEKKYIEEYKKLVSKRDTLNEWSGKFSNLLAKTKAYTTAVETKKEEIVKAKKNLFNEKKELERKKAKNRDLQEDLKRIGDFKKIISDEAICELVLKAKYLKPITDLLNPIFKKLERLYINFYSNALLDPTISDHEKSDILSSGLSVLLQIEKVLLPEINYDLKRFQEFDSSNINQFKIDKIDKKIKQIEQELNSIDDELQELKLYKRIKALEKEKRAIETILNYKIYEKFFTIKDAENDTEFSRTLFRWENQEKSKAKEFLEGVVKEVETIDFGQIKKRLKTLADGFLDNIVIEEITDKKVKVLTAKLKNIENEIKEQVKSYAFNQKEINNQKKALSKILDVNPDDESDEIIQIVSNEILNIEHQIQNHPSDDKYIRMILNEWVDKLRNPATIENDSERILEKYIENCNVVGITCNENPKTILNKGFTDFDIAIIDEVSKATPPELLYPMSISQKAILVGDHRQLPPVFTFREDMSIQEIIHDNESNNNLLTKINFEKFKKMVTASLFKEYFEKADDSIKQSLMTQYRMHTQIMDVINYFYENKLEQGIEDPDRERNHQITIKAIDWTEFINPGKHAIWVDSSKDQHGTVFYEQQDGTSKTNSLECDIINALLLKLNKEMLKLGFNEKNRKDVGVISFYGKQVGLLKRTIGGWKGRLSKFKALKVDINSVDRFQGKENSIIIVSMVRHKKILEKFKKYQTGRDVAFVAQFERINVAFSRAQELLIVVGAKDMFYDYEVKLPKMDSEGYVVREVYKNILSHLHSKACLFDSKAVLKG